MRFEVSTKREEGIKLRRIRMRVSLLTLANRNKRFILIETPPGSGKIVYIFVCFFINAVPVLLLSDFTLILA